MEDSLVVEEGMLIPLSRVSFTFSSCFKAIFTEKKLNNHIVEIHKDPKSYFWGLLRHQITCHSPPFPVWQNSATTVARTFKKKCLSTCWWSMEPVVSKKYCKTDIGLSCRHAKGSALSSSRRGSALRST